MKLRITGYGLRVTMSILILSFILSGCVVRTYQVTKERLDQDLEAGNRGYLKGQEPEKKQIGERKKTRNIQALEIELHSPIRFEKMPKEKPATEREIQAEISESTIQEKTEDRLIQGNRGFITESYVPEITETEVGAAKPQISVSLEKYTVKEGDTLQKISKKFYGSSKQWTKIYERNLDKLRGPDKIYPGQVIDIPIESELPKEIQENLK